MRFIVVWYTEDESTKQAYFFFLMQYISHTFDAISPQALI